MNSTSNKPLAVVTGASSGIGYELAKQFATNGFDLIVAAEDEGIDHVNATMNLLTDALLSHFSYEERELIGPLARHGFY